MRFKIVILLLLFVHSIRLSAGTQLVEGDTIVMLEDKALQDELMLTIKSQKVEIDSLNGLNQTLEQLLKEQYSKTLEKEQNVTDLKSVLAQKEDSLSILKSKNDDLQRKLVSMASNFLYIPYEDYSVNKIAIPAFKAVEGTDLYSKYKIRLDLLENYLNDIVSLKAYVEGLLSNKRNKQSILREKRAEEMCTEFMSTEFLSRYEKYEDWKNTYFGKQLCRVMAILKNPTKENWEKLDDIKTELGTLVNKK